MSAFLCSTLHIRYLVSAGVHFKVIEPGWEDVAGEALLSENHQSLGARYGDDQTHESYKHEPLSCVFEAAQVLHAAGCLSYQSCEHEGWGASAAKALLDSIEAAALASLPARLQELVPDRYNADRQEPRVYQTSEYHESQWEIRDLCKCGTPVRHGTNLQRANTVGLVYTQCVPCTTKPAPIPASDEVRALERAALHDPAAALRLVAVKAREAGIEVQAPKSRHKFEGTKLDERLSTTDIAAAFRVDVKHAQKQGTLPKGLKLSVKSKYYSGGSSINVAIKAAPGLVLLNPEWIRNQIEDPHTYHPNVSRYTPEAFALRESLTKMLNAYNFDNSDSQSDYFHVKFYEHIDFAGELEKAELDAAKVAFAATGRSVSS